MKPTTHLVSVFGLWSGQSAEKPRLPWSKSRILVCLKINKKMQDVVLCFFRDSLTGRKCWSRSGCRQHRWRSATGRSQIETPPPGRSRSHIAQEQSDRYNNNPKEEFKVFLLPFILKRVPSLSHIWSFTWKPPEGAHRWSRRRTRRGGPSCIQ